MLLQQTGVHHALNPDQYRGVFGSDGLKYAKDVEDLINYGTCGNVAGFIAEAIQVLIDVPESVCLKIWLGSNLLCLFLSEFCMLNREWVAF